MSDTISILKEHCKTNNPNISDEELDELFTNISVPMVEQLKDLLDSNFDFSKNTREHQKNDSDISYLNYVKKECDSLTEEIKKRKILYLDTKYWVNIRKAIINNTDNDYKKLYDLLKQKVLEKKIICPLSTEIISELFHQNDGNTLKKTIDIMDDLSDGVSYKFFFDKIVDDFSNFFLKLTADNCKTSVKNFSDFVPVCLVLGAAKIIIGKEYADDSMQKSIFDMCRKMKFQYFGKLPGCIDSTDEQVGNRACAERMNKEKSSRGDKLPNLKKACSDTLYANLICFKEYISQGINNISYLEKNYSLKEIVNKNLPQISIESLDSIIKGITYKFQQGILEKDDIPLLVINSILCGTSYAEKGRKFHPTDFDDYRHAAIAVPSSDFFFTEDNLAHLLNNTTKLSQKYVCKVVSKPKEALELVKRI